MNRGVLALVLLVTGCRGCDPAPAEVLVCGARLPDLEPGAERTGCSLEGSCTLRDGECVAGTDEDCLQSVICAEGGFCTARAGRCWRTAASHAECASPPHPGHAETCATFGLCSVVEGLCQATSDAQCEASLWCGRGGACSARGGRCVATDERRCRESDYCERYAQCSLSGDMCHAISDADCRVHSNQCVAYGRCVLTGDGCMATRPRHCQSSTGCAEDGFCSLEDGRCVGATKTKTP